MQIILVILHFTVFKENFLHDKNDNFQEKWK